MSETICLGITTSARIGLLYEKKQIFEKRDGMRFIKQDPPRSFAAALPVEDLTYDCGSISLAINEQITFLDESSKMSHTDVTRREWGYYLTRSCNQHHLEAGWRIGIMRNALARNYVIAVDNDKLGVFNKFLRDSDHELILWVDEL